MLFLAQSFVELLRPGRVSQEEEGGEGQEQNQDQLGVHNS